MTKKASTNSKTKSPSRPSIPPLVTIRLWTAAAGRCQFEGCNKPLWRNDLTMDEVNVALRAHIYAYASGGPRYDAVLSPKLETDFSNLMLVCGECHPTFDNPELVDKYTAERLIEMKQLHEERIELVTGIAQEKRSHVVFYGAKVGRHDSPLHIRDAAAAMFPDFYPASNRAIEIGLKNTVHTDKSAAYWQVESQHLEMQFTERVKSIVGTNEVQHFSVFGLAPMPLLIKLGVLLGEITTASVYQRLREPQTWEWQTTGSFVKHGIRAPAKRASKVALKLELTAPIHDDRVRAILGEDCSIWSVTHDSHGNDYIRIPEHLKDAREVFRKVMNQILSLNPSVEEVHVFPAMPASTAVEFGRVRMPKADPTLVIYDENNGFLPALTIQKA